MALDREVVAKLRERFSDCLCRSCLATAVEAARRRDAGSATSEVLATPTRSTAT
jgi:hypothetical protein